MTESEETANRLKKEHSTVEKHRKYDEWITKTVPERIEKYASRVNAACSDYHFDQLRAKQAALVTAKEVLREVSELYVTRYTLWESVIKHLEG